MFFENSFLTFFFIEVQGVLMLLNKKEPEGFDEEDEKLGKVVAHHVSIFMVTKRVFFWNLSFVAEEKFEASTDAIEPIIFNEKALAEPIWSSIFLHFTTKEKYISRGHDI